MGRTFFIQVIALLFLFGPFCYSQQPVKVSDPRLELKGNTLLISYDILGGAAGEKYLISLDIKDEDGNILNAQTLEGDIGEVDEGGNNKQITWDLEADNIVIKAYVYVKINAKIILPPPPVVAEQPQEEPAQEEESEVSEEAIQDQKVQESAETEPSTEPYHKTYSRAGIILQSLPLPGLGLSRVTGKPHWIRGVAGYGCIAGSVVLNRQAVKTFNSIEDYASTTDAENAFNKSVRQDNISELLGYAAIGIWVVDIVWNIVGTSDLNNISLQGHNKGFSIRSDFDPVTQVPLLGFNYKF